MGNIDQTTLQGNSDAAVTELRALRRDGPWTLAAIPPEGGAIEVESFKGADEVAQMLDWIRSRNGKTNLHWTLNPTRTRMNRKPTKAAIARFEYAHVECDPLGDESSADAKRRHRAALKAMKYPPWKIYDSGNGVVAVWKLKRPVVIEPGDSVTVSECEAVNNGLKLELGGKAHGYDDCQNIDRLLRLPHTVNIPTAKKRAAGRVVELAGNVETFPSRFYLMEELPKAAILKADRNAVLFGGC